MSILRACGIFTIALGVAILAGEVYVVATVPRAKLPTRNPHMFMVVPVAFILIGWKWCFAPPRSENSPVEPASEQSEPDLTGFEKYISFGITRATFYGVSCLILGVGMLISLAAIYWGGTINRDRTGSLVCAGIGPLPLVVFGVYLLLRRKRPGPPPPR